MFSVGTIHHISTWLFFLNPLDRQIVPWYMQHNNSDIYKRAGAASDFLFKRYEFHGCHLLHWNDQNKTGNWIPDTSRTASLLQCVWTTMEDNVVYSVKRKSWKCRPCGRFHFHNSKAVVEVLHRILMLLHLLSPPLDKRHVLPSPQHLSIIHSFTQFKIAVWLKIIQERKRSSIKKQRPSCVLVTDTDTKAFVN